MKFSLRHPIMLVLCYSILLYLFYQSLFYLLGYEDKEVALKYSLLFLFTLFTVFSVSIIAILLIVKAKNFDAVGFAFMALTSIKIGALLYWAQPILKSTSENSKFEKGNFLILFALFLAIETTVAARLLHNKQ